MADAAVRGARKAGHDVETVHLSDYIEGMLGDCRQCRLADGSCGIKDNYEDLLVNRVVEADALIIATPLYWYGMSGRLKTFFDRFFCYTSNSSPHQDAVTKGLTNKRVAVVVSCEESYRGATVGLVTQFQEITRYLHQELVGVVIGVGNSRGEVASDPGRPLDAAEDLGRRLFDIRVTDYRIDTPRSNRVWATSPAAAGAHADDADDA
ncbi:flavodoxin family protein [Yinghuangia sp. ASG 101]|uniref:flavodoxin family protein n=1 Tax=Yinghuangia sp. ASG 101 TaxID=2896848 RepID=UPI001E2B967A|nr:flavodoxin family protein [Yinghuangia sp. ASG 101]UGQ15692.1 flavodoxin family protein [Yinghuangia sp. ASG 101]